MTRIFTRDATRQGSKHVQLGYNNQDARLNETFSVPAWKREYNVCLVSDGCSGFPAYSHTEVGSNLLTLFAFTRIQEFICAGATLGEIPRSLFQACAEFLRDISNKLMPSSVIWPYPASVKGREGWSATKRLRADYLSATLLAVVTDGEDGIIMTNGDGIVLIDNQLTVIDQNDQPDYIASSVNTPGRGFATRMFSLADVHRIVVSTDGLKDLMADPAFVGRMFEHMPGNRMGLQFLLNTTYNATPHLMKDDCTAITLQVVRGDS